MSRKNKARTYIFIYFLIFIVLLNFLFFLYLNAKYTKISSDNTRYLIFSLFSCGELISMFLSFIAIVVACVIPARIMWRQFFSDLNAQYMNNDFAEAIENIIDFFVCDCEKNVDVIAQKYKELFDAADNSKWKKLHNSRRLLSQFYYNIDLCLEKRFLCIGVSRSVLRRLYYEPEADIVKILFYMNKAVENDDEMYKDIHVDDKLNKYKGMKTMNKHMYHIWKLIK